MRTDHLQTLLEVARDDIERRCEQSFYEEHRDSWSKHYGAIKNIIEEINHGLK